MSASSRRKGVVGEREVAAIWQTAGFEVRGLEGMGDHLVVTVPFGMAQAFRRQGRSDKVRTFHSEVKRQERVRIPEWLAQAKREAPQGTIPVVAFRQNQGEWYAALPLTALVELAS